MRLGMTTAIMKQFEKDHKLCNKTWVEPVNENPETKSETENSIWWSLNGEHGLSSKTIFNRLCMPPVKHLPLTNETHPSDPDDFRRCYLLLKSVPQWKDKLYKLKNLNNPWDKLIENWDKLTELLEEQILFGKENGMYDFMKSLGC